MCWLCIVSISLIVRLCEFDGLTYLNAQALTITNDTKCTGPSQIINSPFGVSVLGSSVIKVTPNLASIKLVLSELRRNLKIYAIF